MLYKNVKISYILFWLNNNIPNSKYKFTMVE